VLLPLRAQEGYTPRVMVLGGGTDDSPLQATNSTEIIDLADPAPRWRASAPMALPRVQMNAVVLPDGRVLALGGSQYDANVATASLAADLFDPTAETMAAAGSARFARLYHSVALLLPDATVWVAGSNPT
jgi:hypothetical protein